MRKQPKGTLIIIGGHENKDGGARILEAVTRKVITTQGNLVITAVAALGLALVIGRFAFPMSDER